MAWRMSMAANGINGESQYRRKATIESIMASEKLSVNAIVLKMAINHNLVCNKYQLANTCERRNQKQ